MTALKVGPATFRGLGKMPAISGDRNGQARLAMKHREDGVGLARLDGVEKCDGRADENGGRKCRGGMRWLE